VWKLFQGNTDSLTVQHSYVDEPFTARYVKFHTTSWTRHPSMRVELIGCQGLKFIRLSLSFILAVFTHGCRWKIIASRTLPPNALKTRGRTRYRPIGVDIETPKAPRTLSQSKRIYVQGGRKNRTVFRSF